MGVSASLTCLCNRYDLLAPALWLASIRGVAEGLGCHFRAIGNGRLDRLVQGSGG